MNGAQTLIQVLEDHGVDTIFGYPGGAVLPIYDALFEHPRMRHIMVRHEQAAVHAAEGYARSTGRLGVVLVTSGPGATNTVTGLLDAMMDSVPVLCLTGQVPTHLIGNDAFQEADTTGITRPVTKHNVLVRNGAELAARVHEAIHIACTGRPGPVLVDLPKDVMIGPAVYMPASSAPHRSYTVQTEPERDAIRQAVAWLRAAKRPMLYTGGGVINAGPQASLDLTAFMRMSGIPCTNTLMGLGAVPASDPKFLGMLGMHGTFEANMAMHGCDVLLNIGARFDDRITGRVGAFSPNSRKIHADIDPSSINKSIRVDLGIIGDAGEVIQAITEAWIESSDAQADLAPWWAQIQEWRAKKSLHFVQDMTNGAVIKPQHAIQRLHEITRERGRETYITTEVGQHQMWAAQYIGFEKPNRWMTSGGLGTMGYGLPAAMGVQVAHPNALVIDVAGEGSILMNIQELSTIVQYKLPVKVVIINNKYLGMVRQWQELLHDKRYSESISHALPDFVKLAESFHAHGLRARSIDELDDVYHRMLDIPGPVIVDVDVDPDENCYPMIPSGAAHNEMILGPGHEAEAASITQEGLMLV